MSEIRNRPPVGPRDVIPPVQPVTPGQPNREHREGDQPHKPEKIKTREGERKRIWVPATSGTYNKSGKKDGEWKMLTQEETEELGLKWEE